MRLFVVVLVLIATVTVVAALKTDTDTIDTDPLVFLNKCKRCCIHLGDAVSLITCVNNSLMFVPHNGSNQSEQQWRTGAHFVLVTRVTPEIYSYASLSFFLQAAYASYRGYTLFPLVPDDETEVDYQYYRKLAPLLRVMLECRTWSRPCDYIVWMDADAVVVDFEFSFESLVRRYPTSHLIASADVSSRINSGIMILKVSPWTIFLLEEWKSRAAIATTATAAAAAAAAAVNDGNNIGNNAATADGGHSSAASTFVPVPIPHSATDQEGFDSLYASLSTIHQDRIAILSPSAINTELPAMLTYTTSQMKMQMQMQDQMQDQHHHHHQHHHQYQPVLHLAAESNAYRAAVFSHLARDLCGSCYSNSNRNRNSSSNSNSNRNSSSNSSASSPPPPSAPFHRFNLTAVILQRIGVKVYSSAFATDMSQVSVLCLRLQHLLDATSTIGGCLCPGGDDVCDGDIGVNTRVYSKSPTETETETETKLVVEEAKDPTADQCGVLMQTLMQRLTSLRRTGSKYAFSLAYSAASVVAAAKTETVGAMEAEAKAKAETETETSGEIETAESLQSRLHLMTKLHSVLTQVFTAVAGSSSLPNSSSDEIEPGAYDSSVSLDRCLARIRIRSSSSSGYGRSEVGAAFGSLIAQLTAFKEASTASYNNNINNSDCDNALNNRSSIEGLRCVRPQPCTSDVICHSHGHAACDCLMLLYAQLPEITKLSLEVSQEYYSALISVRRQHDRELKRKLQQQVQQEQQMQQQEEELTKKTSQPHQNQQHQHQQQVHQQQQQSLQLHRHHRDHPNQLLEYASHLEAVYLCIKAHLRALLVVTSPKQRDLVRKMELEFERYSDLHKHRHRH